MQARMVLSTSETTNATVPATQFGAFAMQSILDGNFSDAVHVETNSNRSGKYFSFIIPVFAEKVLIFS